MSDQGVLVCGEITDGALDVTTFQLLGIGKRLANDLRVGLSVVLIGDNLNEIAGEISSFGADKVYKLENPLLVNYIPDLWVKALEDLCIQIEPRILLMIHSTIWIEIAPRLSFRLNAPLTTDCIDLEIDREDGLLRRSKPVYGGNAIAIFKFREEPQLVTIRKNVMSPAERTSTKGEVIDMVPDIDESMIKVESIKIVKQEEVGLHKADVVIAGGRGIGSVDGFEELENLANLFKKTNSIGIGCSRPAVDSGWMPSNCQIGLTGEIVSPDLYIAVGISGAIQHLVGMTRSKKIVAVNTDANCNIFNVADYGVVGDYKKVLPALKRKLEELS